MSVFLKFSQVCRGVAMSIGVDELSRRLQIPGPQLGNERRHADASSDPQRWRSRGVCEKMSIGSLHASCDASLQSLNLAGAVPKRLHGKDQRSVSMRVANCIRMKSAATPVVRPFEERDHYKLPG